MNGKWLNSNLWKSWVGWRVSYKEKFIGLLTHFYSLPFSLLHNHNKSLLYIGPSFTPITIPGLLLHKRIRAQAMGFIKWHGFNVFNGEGEQKSRGLGKWIFSQDTRLRWLKGWSPLDLECVTRLVKYYIIFIFN